MTLKIVRSLIAFKKLVDLLKSFSLCLYNTLSVHVGRALRQLIRYSERSAAHPDSIKVSAQSKQCNCRVQQSENNWISLNI